MPKTLVLKVEHKETRSERTRELAPDDLIVSMHLDKRLGPSSIAKELGVSYSYVKKRLRHLDAFIPLIEVSDELSIDDDLFRRLHVEADMSISAIYDQYNTGNMSLQTWIARAKELGFYRGDLRKDKYKIINWDAIDLNRTYKYTDKPICEIAKIYETTQEIVRRKLIDLGIYEWRDRRFIDKHGRSITRKHIVNCHVKRGWGTSQLSDKFGRSIGFYFEYLNKVGVYKNPKWKYDPDTDKWTDEHTQKLKEVYLESRFMKDVFAAFPDFHKQRVRRAIRKNGFDKIKGQMRKERAYKLKNDAALRTNIVLDLMENKHSIEELAKIYDVQEKSISKLAKNKGIKIKGGVNCSLDMIPDEELLHVYKTGLNPNAMAEEYGCSRKSVVRRLELAGVVFEKVEKSPGLSVVSDEQIIDAYVTQKMSVASASKLFRCRKKNFVKRLKEMGIRQRTGSEQLRIDNDKELPNVTDEHLAFCHVELKNGITELSRKFGHGPNVIVKRLKAIGVYKGRQRPVGIKSVSDEKIHNLYVAQELGLSAVADEIQCSRESLKKRLRDMGVRVRSRKEQGEIDSERRRRKKKQCQPQ